MRPSELVLPDAIAQAEDLPSLPAVAVEVLRLCRSEDTTLDDLADCLARDPALASRLLRFSNSTLYNLGAEVTTLQRAALVLGMKTVQLMALSFSLAGSLPRSGSGEGFDYDEFWRRSLATAVAGRTLAGLVRSMAEDEAFLCGLLSEIGRMVIARSLPGDYAEVLDHTAGKWPTATIEREVLGYDSAAIGAALLRNWELPEIIYATVGCAESPEELPDDVSAEVRDLVRVVAVARATAEMIVGEQRGEALARVERMAAEYFELPAEFVHAYFTSLEVGIRETSEMLNLRLDGGASHDDLLEEAKREMLRIGMGSVRELEHGAGTPELQHRQRIPAETVRVDSATGLPDRAALDEFLAAELEARAAGFVERPLGLLAIEVDPLPPGRSAEDREELVLSIAGRLRRLCREGDLVASLGSGRFGIVLGEAGLPTLRVLAERLRRGVENHELERPDGALSGTISVGGACLGSAQPETGARMLLRAALHYLELACRSGRNRADLHASLISPRGE